MVLDRPGAPLRAADVPRPAPGPEQVLIRVEACAVCRTDLHVVDGDLPDPKRPLIPGHEIVGTVVAAAHIVAQVARFEGRSVHAFVRRGDDEAARFARELGAVWAGASDEAPPEELDAAIIFAPLGSLVPLALRAVAKGGTVVCGGI